MTKFLTIGTGDALREVAPVSTPAGAADSGKMFVLDSGGRIPLGFMPTGLATPDVQTAAATEALAAGDWVNIYDASGTLSCRKASAVDATKPANGFVKASVTNGASATIYVQGVNSVPVASVNGAAAAKRGKKVCLSASTAGQATVTMPTGSGNLAQCLGDIVDSNGATVNINFIPETGIIRA